ncbi:hypothetical protein ACQVP2_35605 [Methylobacterium aquaticum]|uniref:hypothetical protein n=1 Tax=Methylobacterium aquaticum TaxID=270351 RepID=UPI003D1731F5
MKIYLQEPTVPGRRGIYRAEVVAPDSYGDYGLGQYFGWGYTPAAAEHCALNYGLITEEVADDTEDARLSEAMNDFYDGLAPNRRVAISRWAVR